MVAQIWVGSILTKEFKETYKEFTEYDEFKEYFDELVKKYGINNIFIYFPNLKELYKGDELDGNSVTIKYDWRFYQ